MKKNGSMVGLIRGDLIKEEDLNCSETVLHSANRVYGLGLSTEALKLAAGFGGGMGIEKTCGALTGGVMALSSLFVKERAHESDYIKQICSEFLGRVKTEMGSINCDYLKKYYRDEVTECKPAVLKIAGYLEEIIDRELEKREATESEPAKG